MKLQKNILLTVLASLGLAFAAMHSQAQTFPPPGNNNYYWQAGSGVWDTPSNWNFNGSNAGSAPNAARAVFFGFPGTPGTLGPVTVSLDPAQTAAAGKTFDVMGGDFTFDLAGNTKVATVLGKPWTFGDGAGTGPTVEFTDSVGTNTITFPSIVLGANGSSNNVWGGPNGTITFASNVTPIITGAITVGDGSNGSTGNVFNGTAGQTYGSLIINAGTGNTAHLNGAAISSASTALNLGANTSFTLSTGETITSTLASGSSTTMRGIVTAAGSNLTLDNGSINTKGVSLAGTTTIQNGGSLSTVGDINQQDNISGTLNVTGANSSFSEQTGGLQMAAGAQISVTDGGSFSAAGIAQQSGIINLNVDSSSSFNVTGEIGLGTGNAGSLSITGGGTVNAGSFIAGVSNVGDISVDTGTGILSVNALTLGNGPSIGTRGNVSVTGSLILGKTSTMASGDVLEFNGNNVTVSASSAGKGLAVNAGAVVSGQGHVSQAASNGGIIGITGGTLRVGDASAINGQTLAFNTGSLDVSGGSTLEFSLYADDGSSDQLRIDPTSNVFFTGTTGSLTLKLNLVGDLATLKTLFDAGDTTFDLVGDLDGDALTGAGGSGGLNNLNFTVDSATAALFASEGYSIDTSAFGTTGSISLVAESVPEPSTWALLIASAGLLAYFQRRRISSHRISNHA